MIEFREDCRTWSLRHTCFCHRRMWGGLLGWPGGVEMQRRWVGRRSTAAGCSVSAARRSCYPTVAHLRPWVARQRKSREKRPGGGEEGRARTWGSSRSSDGPLRQEPAMRWRPPSREERGAARRERLGGGDLSVERMG